MRRIVPAICFLLMSCISSNETSSNALSISSGVYQRTYTDDPEVYQLVLNSDGTYSEPYFTQGCMECELSGIWKVEGDNFKRTKIKERCKNGSVQDFCTASWKPYTLYPDEVRKLRNVSDTSFEELLPADEFSQARWWLWKIL